MAENAYYFGEQENDENPDDPGRVQNNAFMFNSINLDPIQGAIRNVNLDFHFPDFEHFAYKGKSTKQISENWKLKTSFRRRIIFTRKSDLLIFKHPKLVQQI